MTQPFSDEHIVPITNAKESVINLVMYYYTAMRNAGLGERDAKDRVADLLEESYYAYMDSAELEPKTLGSIERKLTKLTEKAKELASENPEVKFLYNELASIQMQIIRKR